MGGVPSSAAPHVFVADLESPVLADGDRHHLEGALRTRVGDAITMSDGRGRWREARFSEPVESLGEVRTVARPVPELTVGFALVKGSRPELVVQKLTELGIDRIVPFRAARSVVRWDDDRAERHLARLTRIAREAAMQSRRCWLPVVEAVADFDDLVSVPAANRVALATPDGDPPALEHPTILVGPEGGWSPEESDRGLAQVRLGPHVLRSETAALVAGAVLAALREGLVRP